MLTVRTRRILGLLALVVCLAGMTGCQTDRLKQERNALWVQNQELQDELNRARAALDACEADRSDLLAQLDQARAAAAAQPAPAPAPAASSQTGFSSIEGVETVRGVGTIGVRVPGDVLFAPGKADLKASAQSTLAKIARVIKSEYPGKTIRIEGYTDTDPIRKSKWTDNLELSLHRAAAVERYLTKQGIDADATYSAGFGESKARASKAQSRRVEIVVLLQE